MSTFDYPNQPGDRGVETSIAAARSITNAASRLQRAALFALQEVGLRGLTSEELAARTGIAFESIQPRTSELRRKGLIRDSGERRPNRRGHRTIVWIAAASGERA